MRLLLYMGRPNASRMVSCIATALGLKDLGSGPGLMLKPWTLMGFKILAGIGCPIL